MNQKEFTDALIKVNDIPNIFQAKTVYGKPLIEFEWKMVNKTLEDKDYNSMLAYIKSVLISSTIIREFTVEETFAFVATWNFYYLGILKQLNQAISVDEMLFFNSK